MQVPETDVTWTYSLLTASESKASARTGTPPTNAAELVGVDGSNNGGIQPFPGFRELHRFAPELANSAYGGISFTSSNPYSSVAHRSRVVDFWSFSVIAGASTRVFGYVYLIRRPNDMTTPTCNNVYDLMMEFYAPNGSTTPQFRTILLQENIQPGAASLLADQGKAVMSVETTGKAVYIFRRGVPPIAVYFKVASTSSTPATLVSPAGPGVIPKSTLFSGTFGNSSTHNLAPSAPLTTPFPNPTTGGNPLGSVVFARTTTNPNDASGAAPISNFATAPVQLAGTYSLAVQFEDTRSGRKSQLTTNIELTFTGGSNAFLIDGIYNNDYYDTLNVYRSVRTGNAAGAYTSGILQLEAQITLSSYVTTTLPVSGASLPSGSNIKYFRYAYQLTDSALVMQDVFLDKPSYSTEMPKGGAGALLDGTMLVGNISDSPSDLTGTGETRWSAGGADSPELFTASGIYKPSNVGDAVTCFKRTGQIMAGLTRNGVQIFNKDNGFVRVLAAHQGYGVTGPYAATTVGPVTYFMNYRGLKAIYPDGRLDDVQAINQLVSEQWYSGTTGAQELSKVSMAFDPATLCMYILNPTRQQAVQMWFATGVVSELQDMSFAKVTQGWWEDADGQLVPRALFLFNAPYPDAVTNTNFRPAVYMPCRNYNDKVFSPSKPVVGMLDANINRAPTTTINIPEPDPPTTASYFDDTCTVQSVEYVDIAASLVSTDPTINYRMIGMSVYAVAPLTNPTVIAKAKIIDATGSVIRMTTGILGSGIQLSIDPVYVKWVGAPMKLSESKDEDFVVKQPTSMGAVFSNYESASQSPTNKYWVGSLYRNEETTPLLSYVPTLPDGTPVANSIQEGDTPHWVAFGKHSYLGQWFFPSFETFMANVKYRLVGVQVKGRILPTDRTRRTY
jgi:hypothetical protein